MLLPRGIATPNFKFLLKPYPNRDGDRYGFAVIGMIEGDTCDISKRIVNSSMEPYGFDMIDLRCDVSIEKFMERLGRTIFR
ncbi:MAG: hypothetical protein AMR96_04970 [Candidatus Adiutrix intracellularis]|nr:MAG: hypothetical protein AMR96_04970 [Candidatus Adiutrix intracellularis]